MYSYSEILGKNIVLLGDGNSVGTVENLLVDKASNTAVAVTDKGRVCLSGIFRVKDALTVEKAVETEGGVDIVDKDIFDTKGVYLGKVTDVLFDKDSVVKRFVAGEKAFAAGRVYKVGDTVLIKSSLPKGKGNRKEEIKTAKRYGDFDFLIGSVVNKTIYDFSGNILIDEGTVVTKSLLSKARINGKLMELALNCGERGN
jgi:sporulation protein YlmC with PRC-barrel domain